ncbi:MAG: hypothetical protein IEMM0006_1929 [bacterium]|nr:MAG: hypothetical protein IEMM0006_1929 [bacterium]
MTRLRRGMIFAEMDKVAEGKLTKEMREKMMTMLETIDRNEVNES